MCEQTEVEYLPDEVVWVKLHQPSLWWPGQVQDYEKLPEDITEGLRKKPIAIVKFFQEDSYEYVNNLNNIYRYNCSKKHEFIKKGLALARSKRPERPSHMDLFPQDVATAETLTHGNPDIIRDEAFAPEEKPKYDGLFGSDKKKNLKKAKSVVESILKERPSWRVKPLIAKSSSSPKTPSSPKTSKVITHPRFINKALKGETDYRIFIREQPVVEDETASPSSQYRCHNCDFVTSRLNVIVLHYRSHSKSVTPIPRTKPPKPKSAKSSVTKTKVETPVKSTPSEPLKKRNILRDSPPPEEKTEKTSPKKSPKALTPKTQAPKRKAKPDKPEIEEKKAKKEEIQELLKDWSDEELEEESQIVGTASVEDEALKEEVDSKMDVDEPVADPSEKPVKASGKPVGEPVGEPIGKIDEASVKKVDEVSVKKVDEAGVKKVDEASVKKVDEASVKKVDEAGVKKGDEAGVKKGDEASVKKVGEASVKKVGEASVKEVDEPSKKKADEPSKKADEPSKETVDEPKQKRVNEKPVKHGKKDESKGKDDLRTTAAKSKAVFDFDDDDEGLDPKLTQSTRVFGRKIPRVIDHIKEKRTSFPDHSPDREEEEKKKEGRKSSKGVADSCDKIDAESTKQEEDLARQKELDSMNAEIDSLLEKTAVPDLPEIPKLNTFSMDVSDDSQVPTKEEVKDKSVLREHFDNNISSESVKESLEDGSQTEETSKNSLPEVGSAVEEISTPPQADSVVNTAESSTVVPEIVKSAVITSVIFSSPQSTSGGDHSYVSEKRPPVSKMPPLVPTSPKSPPSRSHTYILSRSSPVKSRTSRTPEDAGVMRVVNVAPTTKTTKPVPSLVKKDKGKYVIVRTTQSGDIKVMPSLTPTSAVTRQVFAQPQTGKKLVILTKKPSGDVVLSSQKQTNLVGNIPPKSLPVVTSSPVIASASASSVPVLAQQVSPSRMAPKKNLLLSATGGSRDAKTVTLPASNINTSSPGALTSRASSSSKPVVLPQTVKLVGSKDSPGKVLLQMDSQKTRVTLPTMRRAGSQIQLANKEVPSASNPPSLRMTTVAPPKMPTTSTSPRTLASVSSPKSVTGLTSPKSSKPVPLLRTAVQSPHALASPTTAKPLPKPTTNKFFNRDPTASPKPVLKKQPVPMKKTVEVPNKMPTFVSQTQTKPSILSANRGNTKRSTPQKITPRKPATKETKSQAAVVSSAPVELSITPEGTLGSTIVAAQVEGSVDSGTVMYILDNGALISYDQGNEADSQGRTVYLDPASLTATSGDLSNLIFTFDESTGSQGALLSLPQAEGTQPTEYAFAPGTGRPPGSATQDILAEALANTQVLQAEASASEMILDAASLATNTIPSSSALYPNNVLTLSNNVLETSLTLNAPIMTPLEVPSAVSSLQPPPAASGSLELPITIAQPDITISTSSYASLPIPSASIQGTVFSDSTTATYSTIVPVLAGDADKQTLFVEATSADGTAFEVSGGGATVFVCEDQLETEPPGGVSADA